MTTQGFPPHTQVTTATTGTGTLTLGAASTGCMGTEQLVDGDAYDYTLKDVNGGDIEHGRGIYTASGTTLTRAIVTSSKIAGVAGATKLTLSGSGSLVFFPLSADREARRYQADQIHIHGLLVTRKTSTTWTVKAGSCFDPSSGKIITLAADTDISPSLGNNQNWSFYLYDSAGTATIDAQQESPPATPYAGNARKRGSGNGGRFIGWGFTDGSAHIRSNRVRETAQGQVTYDVLENRAAAPYRVIDGGTDTAYATSGEITLLASSTKCIPRYIATAVHFSINATLATTAAHTATVSLSNDGTNDAFVASMYVETTATFPGPSDWVEIEPDMPGIWYKVATSTGGVDPTLYLDVMGFRYVR